MLLILTSWIRLDKDQLMIPQTILDGVQAVDYNIGEDDRCMGRGNIDIIYCNIAESFANSAGCK